MTEGYESDNNPKPMGCAIVVMGLLIAWGIDASSAEPLLRMLAIMVAGIAVASAAYTLNADWSGILQRLLYGLAVLGLIVVVGISVYSLVVETLNPKVLSATSLYASAVAIGAVFRGRRQYE